MLKIALEKELRAAQGHGESSRLIFEAEIESRSITTIFGASGEGKTTLLRMIAGLVRPDRGSIVIDLETWFDSAKKIDLTPQKRSVGFVFQNYALFPAMTVEKNIKFAGNDPDLFRRLIELLGLQRQLQKQPQQLSGGEQQRVALARALMRRPELLLLDEPFAAMDEELKLRLHSELLVLHQELPITTLLVTHDWRDALRLSDTTIELEAHTIKRQGSTRDLLASKIKNLANELKTYQ